MRSILRHAAVIAATVSLVFFWSCERHEVGELPDHHAPGKAGEAHHPGAAHGHDAHGKAGHADDNPNPADGGMHQHGTGHPTGKAVDDPHLSGQAIPPVGAPQMAPAEKPPQFFPSPSPSPR